MSDRTVLVVEDFDDTRTHGQTETDRVPVVAMSAHGEGNFGRYAACGGTPRLRPERPR